MTSSTSSDLETAPETLEDTANAPDLPDLMGGLEDATAGEQSPGTDGEKPDWRIVELDRVDEDGNPVELEIFSREKFISMWVFAHALPEALASQYPDRVPERVTKQLGAITLKTFDGIDPATATLGELMALPVDTLPDLARSYGGREAGGAIYDWIVSTRMEGLLRYLRVDGAALGDGVKILAAIWYVISTGKALIGAARAVNSPEIEDGGADGER